MILSFHSLGCLRGVTAFCRTFERSYRYDSHRLILRWNDSFRLSVMSKCVSHLATGTRGDKSSPAQGKRAHLNTAIRLVPILIDELLNRELFLSIDELRYVADRWRMDYNHYRPHSSADYMAPAAFAAICLEQGSRSLRLPQDSQDIALKPSFVLVDTRKN